MLILLMCLGVAVMRLWPQTPVGRLLHRWLVEAPARRLTPGVMIFGTFLLLAVVGAVAWGKSEGLMVAAQGADAIGWFVTFDIGTYIDVIAVAWLLAASVRLRALSAALRVGVANGARWARRLGGARAPRQPRRPRRRTPPPADEGRAWAGLAFA